MNEMIAQLGRLKARAKGYWADRITAELDYAARLSRLENRRHDPLLRSLIASLESEADEAGAVTREIVEEAEGKLGPLAAEAKAYTLTCAAHAHIDMNWLWRYDETVSVTLDTFRTMLDLMNEYPGFTFSQSQASVYRIVEEHDPDLLKEIRRRVKEGRWEVTASTWVETDKNMPCGESLARHVLYTKRYFARLFDLEAERLAIDFEPDTFGHSRNVPEIMVRGGVRHYYHCRGYDEHNLYRWQAPSGAEVLVYRDPFWYNAEVSSAMAAPVPEFCRRHGMDTMLRSYGVGDHGGGPTRRDIERIIDMDTWPVFPRVRFGTFAGYFALAEKVRERLPVVNRELNAIFTGCYTTQTRIKAANRTAEARLAEAEAFSGAAALAAGGHYRHDVFTRAWERVLFNHFHDILPGSGIVDTREFALGQFQQAMASATTEQTLALRRIAAQVDTADLAERRAAPTDMPWDDARADTSEGAGVGWGIDGFQVAAVARGGGRTRIFHVFNALAHARHGIAELVVWDWDGDPKRLVVKDASGTVIPHQILPAEPQRFFKAGDYWGHAYFRVVVPVQVPGLGYTTVALSEAVPSELELPVPNDPRVERPDAFVLENERLRAGFDTVSCRLTSLVDKASGEELLGSAGAGFRRVDEDDAKGMTAWTVGRWMTVRSVHEGVRVAAQGLVKGPVRQSLAYEIAFDSSKLRAVVSLDRDSPVLKWNVECEWLEAGRKGAPIPQLNFHLPLAFECRSYRYDVPFGTVDRAPVAQDMPATSWAAAVSKKAGRRAVMLVAGQKHGFRCVDDALSLTLIRSSYDPDPFPELGVHRFDFGISLGEGTSPAGLIRAAAEYRHGVSVLSVAPHAGTLPKTHGFAELEAGTVILAAVKMAEDGGRRLVLRLHEADGKEATAVVRFYAPPAAAWVADLNEHRLESGPAARVDGPAVSVPVAPHAVLTLVVEFPRSEVVSEIELVADYACLTGENPLWHPMEKRLYWLDIPRGRMFRYDPATGKHEPCYEGGQVGGFTIQADGSLLLFGERGSIRVWREAVTRTIVEEVTGERASRFNDVIADPAGRMFCGTMEQPDRSPGSLYRLDLDGTLTRVLGGVGCSNGMGFTPDRKRMYYTDSKPREVYVFDYDRRTGSLSDRRLFLRLPEGAIPDGLTVDAEGAVWCAIWGGGCVMRFSPEGKELGRIELPAKLCASLTFAGPDCADLYVTCAGGDDKRANGPGAGGLYRVRGTGHRGVPEFFSRIGL